MPETWTFDDFSEGWILSDDAISGRKNGFLRFNNCELDSRGAVVLTQPPLKSGPALETDAHTIWSKFINGLRSRYYALTNGKVLVDGSTIFSGGSTTRAAFGVAFNWTLICSGSKRQKYDGTNTYNLGILKPTVAPSVVNSGAGPLTGSYEYIQINVFKSGSYVGKSPASLKSSIITLTNNQTTVTPQDPSGVDPQCNEAWIFRRGGTLDQFYRVKQLTTTTGFGAFVDNFTDQDAITLNIKLIETSLSLSVTDLPDPIIEIVGPINGRHLYFTATNIYFSEINSPDSYDSRAVMPICSNTSEIFLWARQVAENVVLIGTGHTVYALTGNYVQFPDGFMDVYLRSTGTDTPPLHIDAAVHEGTAVYDSSFGWVALNSSGIPQSLVSTDVDLSYRGQKRHGYNGVAAIPYPANNIRYPCAISRDKLWVAMPVVDPDTHVFTTRMDIYDFKRKYWRTVDYSNACGNPTILFSEEDDNVFGYFPSDKIIRDFDVWFQGNNKLIDFTTKQQLELKTPFFDFNFPRNRKNLYTIKLKVNTGGDPVTVTVYFNNDVDNVAGISLGTLTSTTLTELVIDTKDIFTEMGVSGSGAPIKNIQIKLTGTVSDFQLNYIAFEYDNKPLQLPSLILGPLDFGTSSRKRVSMIPFVLDTLGNTVTVEAYVDRVLHSSKTYISSYKKSFEYQFDPPAVGKDFELRFYTSTCVAEQGIAPVIFTSGMCDSVCAAALFARYAAGTLCPLNEEITLYTDNFSGYGVGSAIADPPWTEIRNSGNVVWTRNDLGGVPVAVGQQLVTSSGLVNYHIFNQGYTGFNSTTCGVWISCILKEITRVFGTDLSGGLVIGCGDFSTTLRLQWNWFACGNVAGQVLLSTVWTTGGTVMIGVAGTPAVGDVAKFKLSNTGAFGWRLETYINGVVIGSTTSSQIQMATATPKSLGFWCGNATSGADLTSRIKIADVRMGVC